MPPHLAASPATGTFPERWICGDDPAEPALQVHAYGHDLYILRQSMALNFEAPFLYLLAGDERALLVDTGSGGGLPLAATLEPLLARWARERGLAQLPLVVAHTHGHFDHLANDGQFLARPQTVVLGHSRAALCRAFGIARWPDDAGSIDLGGRVLDVLPTPGHHVANVCFYDRRSGTALTGDTFYPGFLFITDFAAYRASIRRLHEFAARQPVTFWLGSHVEMTRTPGRAYPYGTQRQPDERPLQLLPERLGALLSALDAMADAPHELALPDCVIKPAAGAGSG